MAMDVHGIARDRVEWALGGEAAERVMKATLTRLGLRYLHTADDLRAFAEAIGRDEALAWVGTLLVLHSEAIRAGRRL